MIKKKIKTIYLNIMGFFKTPKNYIYILNGHDLGNDALKSQERFRQLLLTLSEKSKLVSFDNAVKLIKSNTKVDKPHIAFSFDDAFKDCIQIASILEEFGITGGFFICPEYIEGMRIDEDRKGDLYKFNKDFLSLKDVLSMKEAGHTFGAHTYSHVRLDDLITEKDIFEQIIEEKKVILKHTGIDCKYFAIPYGRYNNPRENVLSELQKLYANIFLSDNRILKMKHNNMINRRHFECDWSSNRVHYFLSNYK
jgi:peptidoglycan/xylan/chitin deacetylase (PgdA/CDA1 family)